MEGEYNTTGKETYSSFDSTVWSETDLEQDGNLVAVAIPLDKFLDDASAGPISIRQDMNMEFNAHHQGSEQRRRSSTVMYNNFINEMGSGNNPDGTERRRTSLDSFCDAALAVYNQEHQMGSTVGSTAASGHMDMGPIDTPRRTSLYSLVTGDSTLGRRNSLTQILVASEFAKPSRRSSMATPTGTEPIDRFQAKLAAVGLGSGLVDFPNNHNSELGFPNSQDNGPPDMITLQLLQQQNAEEEHALSSNDEDYIQLQKLQTILRRTSISNIFDEITTMHRTNQNQGNDQMQMERRHVMEQKRTSLDLLGNAALAVYNQEHQMESTAASGHMGMGPIDTPRRSSLCFLVRGDSTLGRRNSLTQILVASEFAKPSRRSSMATGTEPIDPFHMDALFDDQPAKPAAVELGSGLVGFPNNHNSELGFPNSQNSGPPDMITLQLLQQQTAEEETALYIQFQKLQTELRRQSITNLFDEITAMHRMNQNQGNDPMQMEIFSPKAQAQLESFQIYEEKQHKKHNQRVRKTVRKRAVKKAEPEPEPEYDEVPLFTDKQVDSFQTSMEKSSKTQKDIQHWDKKMGLKRNESDTMTKNKRARKNLKKILDKDRNLLKEIETTDNKSL